MENKSRKALVKDVAYALLDLDSQELAKLAASVISRDVVAVEEDLFEVGSGEFQPIRQKYSKDECCNIFTLDGKKLSDNSRLTILMPDNSEYDVVLEEDNRTSLSEDLYFLASFHGMSVRIGIKVGMKAKWAE